MSQRGTGHISAEQEAFASQVLDSIIQNGQLDLPKIMRFLMQTSGSSYGYFFDVHNVEDFHCLFSSDSKTYEQGHVYSFAEIPDTHYDIYVRDAIVAAIALEKEPTELLGFLHNHISVGLHFARTQTSYQSFIVNISNNIIRNLADMWNQIQTAPGIKANTEDEAERLSIVVRDIGNSLNFFRDVRDYAALMQGQGILKEGETNLQAIVAKSQREVYPRQVTVVPKGTLPEWLIIDGPRLNRSIMVPILMAYPRDADLTLEISTEPTGVATGLLYMHLKGQVPLEMRSVIPSRYVDPEYLNLYLAKKLCEAGGGFIKMPNDNELLFAVKFSYSSRDNVFRNVRVLLMAQNEDLRRAIYDVLSELTANVTLVSSDSDATLYLSNVRSYAVVVTDDHFGQKYTNRIKMNKVPVIGLTENNLYGYDAIVPIVPGKTDREIVEAYRRILQGPAGRTPNA